jgi:hypothetical protein
MADTLMSEIIVQAFREGNFTALGEDTTAEELTESVARLRNLINAVFGFELGELQRDWYVPHEHDPEAPLRYPLAPTGTGVTSAAPYQYPPSNVRLLVKVDAARTLYFPAYPFDGARISYLDMGSTADVTIDGNGRLIEGATSITTDLDPDGEDPVVSFHGRKWLYRADRGEWILLTDLQAGDSVPTPPEFDALWISGLAVSLAPRFQVQIQEQTAATYQDMLGRLKRRYKQSERLPSSMELRQIFREI